MKHIFFLSIFIWLANTNLNFSQELNDVLFLEYSSQNIKVTETKISDRLEIELYYSILSRDEKKPTTFIFKVNNISENFKFLKFEEIKDSLTTEEIKFNKPFSVEDLEDFNHCDLHIKLSDSKKIYLIKKNQGKYYKYILKYWSTRRGWEFSDN